MAEDRGVLRIGEVARRTGVGVSTLRAWERRYGLLDPIRTGGGHRLYSERDVAQIRRMQDLIEEGWNASEAARELDRPSASATPPRGVDLGGDPAAALGAQLRDCLDRFDAAGADRVLDDTLARFELGTAVDEVIGPALVWAGEGWQGDARVVAREHFASNTLRPRLLRLLRVATSPSGRTAVAAAPEHDEHDLGLLCASAILAEAGWNVRFLGARTPTGALERTVTEFGSRLVVVAATMPEAADAFVDDPPAVEATLLLGGAGFTQRHAEALPRAVRHVGAFRNVPRTVADALRDAG